MRTSFMDGSYPILDFLRGNMSSFEKLSVKFCLSYVTYKWQKVPSGTVCPCLIYLNDFQKKSNKRSFYNSELQVFQFFTSMKTYIINLLITEIEFFSIVVKFGRRKNDHSRLFIFDALTHAGFLLISFLLLIYRLFQGIRPSIGKISQRIIFSHF